jgi:hypothetical protein
MWDYNPIMTSGYVNQGKAGPGAVLPDRPDARLPRHGPVDEEPVQRKTVTLVPPDVFYCDIEGEVA